MISKELLSEVLGEECFTEVKSYASDIPDYKSWLNGSQFMYSTCSYKWSGNHINIYELAHKCKEWARSKDYSLGVFNPDVDCFEVSIQHYVKGHGEWNEVFEITSDTEPESIFQACKWILENK